MTKISTVNILVDNESWILPYAQKLADWCLEQGVIVNFVRHQNDLLVYDVSFFLGCISLVTQENLSKSRHNLVVHESDLPSGKGFAPVAWQILEGKTTIPVCLIEAAAAADSGDIWLKGEIRLSGTELYEEWRHKQGLVTLELCQLFITSYSELVPVSQSGEGTFYGRRRPKDSELAVEKTLEEQFDLLRTVDNKNFPAFFHCRGKTYKLEISEYEAK